jgi:hypothetical protein
MKSPARPRLVVLVLVPLLAMFATVAMAHHLSGASAMANCKGYSLSVSGSDLTAGLSYTITYTFTVICNGTSTISPAPSRLPRATAQPPRWRRGLGT